MTVNNISVHTFARHCGITAAALYRIIKGVEPTISSIAKIYEATCGAVGLEDLVSIDNLKMLRKHKGTKKLAAKESQV